MSSLPHNPANSARFRASGPAMLPSDDACILIFGASGDLTARKLMPSLFTLWKKEFLPPDIPIIVVARREKTSASFRAELRDSVSQHVRAVITDEDWQAFSRQVHYVRANLDEAADFTQLRESVEQIEQRPGDRGTRVVYLATDPNLFLPSIESLSRAGMIPPPG